MVSKAGSQAAVEESDKEVNSGGEEIIELQEMRVSPIPSLRNRHKQKYYKDPRGKSTSTWQQDERTLGFFYFDIDIGKQNHH